MKELVTISEVGPWVSRIDWCEGHWCGSTYMVVRLSDVSSKTDENVFLVFLGFFWAYICTLIGGQKRVMYSTKKFESSAFAFDFKL